MAKYSPKEPSLKQEREDVKEEESQDPKQTCSDSKKCQTGDDAMPSDSPKVPSLKQERGYVEGKGRDSKKTVLSPTDKEELEHFVNDIFEKNLIRSKNTRGVDKFFKQEIQLDQSQIETARETFNPLVKKVLSHLETNTPLKWEDLKSGSFYDGTKVSHPDEMDCMFVPEIKNLEVSTEGAPLGFCYVKVTQTQEDFTKSCQEVFLSSTKFRQNIFNVFERMLGEGIRRDTTLGPGSPSFGIDCDTSLKDSKRKFVISIDLVPALYFPGWPKTARDFRSYTQTQLKDISNEGFHVVAKECDTADAKDRDLLWRLSFSKSEKTITKHADQGDKTCRKKVLRILKKILEIAKKEEDYAGMDEGLASQGIEIASELRIAAQYTRYHGHCVAKHRFTTYQLRTLMWNEFYVATPGDRMWGNDNLVNRLKQSIVKLKSMLTGELLVDHFFIPNCDIMAKVPLAERKYLYIMACVAEKLL